MCPDAILMVKFSLRSGNDHFHQEGMTLELLALLLLSRLLSNISIALKDELDLDPPASFTDSKSKLTLYWSIRQEKKWGHRVNEIRCLNARGTVKVKKTQPICHQVLVLQNSQTVQCG